MKTLRLQYPVPLMCRVLEVAASGFYAYLSRPLSKRAQEDLRLEVEIKAAHKRTKQVCGPERLQRDLAEHGVTVGVCRIKRIRKQLGIRCKQVKKFKATTDSKHSHPVADNLLSQKFYGSAISPISPPMRAGCILLVIRICLAARSSAMLWDSG